MPRKAAEKAAPDAPKKPRKPRTPKAPKEERLEDILMACRNDLRGRAAMTDKRDLLLTLVFLKFIGDRFVERRAALEEQHKGEPAELVSLIVSQPSFYGQEGIFYLPDECLWEKLIQVNPAEMAVAFDNAIAKLERDQKSLKNALPQQIFTKTALEAKDLKAVVDDINKIDPKRFQDKDLIGRVYEYYLQAFSINADKEEGEFYTPHSIVELIASLIEPYDGTIYDPCCGSGGMFIQSAKLVAARGGNTKSISVYGQESDPSTFRLAKMNLAVRGISYHLGDKPASTFSNDQHPDKKMTYVMANPPFNLRRWRGADELLDDPRWKGYGVPPEGNANYAWILHILSKLDVSCGIAGFLLANGALEDEDTLDIRKKLVENDKVEAIIVLPREMFYSTDISVTLWILNNNKKGGLRNGRMLRDRSNELLFVDLRTWNNNIYEKKYVQFSHEQIEAVRGIYLDWQMKTEAAEGYARPELYYAAKKEEIAAKGYSLVPSRYIAFVDRDTELDYQTALATAGAKVRELVKRQQENQKNLLEAFKVLGYDGEN